MGGTVQEINQHRLPGKGEDFKKKLKLKTEDMHAIFQTVVESALCFSSVLPCFNSVYSFGKGDLYLKT